MSAIEDNIVERYNQAAQPLPTVRITGQRNSYIAFTIPFHDGAVGMELFPAAGFSVNC